MKRTIRLVSAVLVLGFLLAMPAEALAFTQRTGDTVTVDESINDDLYVTGANIEVSGDVDGDVVAFGQNIRITGDVTGDVISAGQNITVSGAVEGSVRAAGADVVIDGRVAEDVIAAGSTVRVTSGGSVGRDAVIGASSLQLDGDVSRNVVGGADRMSIGALVGGDVTADVARLTVEEDGRVAGDLTYYSDTEARIDGDVGGETNRYAPRREHAEKPDVFGQIVWGVLGWIRGLIGLALFAVLVVLAARPVAERAAYEAWYGRQLLSVALGLGVFAVAFPIAGLVFVTGLILGGWWIAFVWLALVWLLAMFGVVVAAVAIGRWIVDALAHRSVHPVLAAVLGVVVLSIVGAVPFIGWLAFFVAMLLGMGALLLIAYSPRPPAAPDASGQYSI